MCKTRKGSAKCVVAISFVTAIFGIIAILATLGIQSSKADNQAANSVTEIRNTVAWGNKILHVHAITMIVFSIVGCSLYKIKNKCCVTIFGILLMFVWITMTATGTIFSAAAIAAPIFAEGMCASSVDGYLGFGAKKILNNYMCTNACPCEPVASASMRQQSLDTYKKFNRTSTEGVGFDENGFLMMFYQEDASQPRFKTFSDCWSTRLVTRNNSDGTPYFNSTFTGQMNGFLKVMGEMESGVGCSGICQPNLFWFTRPLTNPAPQKSCLDNMTNIVTTKFMMPGLCILAGGFFLMLLWIFQYCLWCKKQDE